MVIDKIRKINNQLAEGSISAYQAQRLAVQALKEVDEKDVGDEDEEDTAGEELADPAEPAAPAPTSSIDPKTQILELLTRLETVFEPAWQSFKTQVEGILKGTTGDAVPIEEFSIGAGSNNAKLLIEVVDANNAAITYTIKKDFTVAGLTLPTPAPVAAGATSCHLELRQGIIALANDTLANSRTHASWDNWSVPLNSIFKMKEDASKENDTRALAVLESVPAKADYSKAKPWQHWAVNAQAYLIGQDYTKGKTFKELLETK